MPGAQAERPQRIESFLQSEFLRELLLRFGSRSLRDSRLVF